MSHFIDEYATKLNELLHGTLPGHYFYKQEVLEVSGLLTAILVTYDGVRDDQRQVHNVSWEEFLSRMGIVKPDWVEFDRAHIEYLAQNPDKVFGGWEGRTIYFIRGGQNSEQWTPAKAQEDVTLLLTGAWSVQGKLLQTELEHLNEAVPLGAEHFQEFEHMVRVTFNYLFRGVLGEGRAQSRTEPEDEGVEIRDVLFANTAETGFWRDLKQKYSASEIVVDAKNKSELTRDDLRQLYCYLKPALGFWGFVVCRAEQTKKIHAFNRTLFQNFRQERGMLILCDDDLRRMVQMRNQGRDPSEYLRQKMSEFTRSI